MIERESTLLPFYLPNTRRVLFFSFSPMPTISILVRRRRFSIGRTRYLQRNLLLRHVGRTLEALGGAPRK